MKKFGPEDFLGGTGSSVGYKINDDQSITLMPVQDMTSLNEANKKAREWFLAGYIPKDILNIGDVNSRLLAGATALTNGAALTASEQQGAMSTNVPGAILDNQPFFGDKKYIANNGGNALYLTSVSKHADKVVQFWSWVFSSQENFDLYNYGIEGVNYELKDNRVAFLDDGYTTFPGWMFKNMNFLRFPEGITDEYIDRMKKWDEGAEISPLMGFTFNPENVTTELAQVNSVWNAYSKTLESGIVDPVKLMPEFIEKIKAAGQDKILQEAQKQVDAFLAAKS
jgi:putative aldouronate transport system substrate-binding protein